MNEENQKQIEALRKLQAPFKPHEISLLPKQMKKDDQDKGRCEAGSRYCADGRPCGGYHARSIHLDYVGHAALTKRLLDVDPLWTWEPVTVGEDRLPHFDKLGGLWIKLTVCGHSRLGYGDSQGKTGNNAIKEAIGDALRNAGMRFGMALELWHKGDLYDADELRGLGAEESAPKAEPKGKITPTTGVLESLSPTRRRELEYMADEVHERFKESDTAASDYLDSCDLTQDEKVALWSLLDSKIRSAIKAVKRAASTSKDHS